MMISITRGSQKEKTEGDDEALRGDKGEEKFNYDLPHVTYQAEELSKTILQVA